MDITYIKGVGPNRAKTLESAGIKTIDELINYLPKSYIDREVLLNIRTLKKNLLSQNTNQIEFLDISDIKITKEVSVIGKVTSKKLNQFSKREMLKLTISDSSDFCNIIFWSRAKYFEKVYNVGDTLLISGNPEIDDFKNLNFSHPEIDKIDKDDEDLFRDGKILPKYKMNEKFVKGNISQKVFRTIIKNAFDSKSFNIVETLPPNLLRKCNLPKLDFAIRNLHFPNNRVELDKSIHRMKFDEILYYLLNVQLLKSGFQNKFEGILIDKKSTSARKLYEKLPFELTQDQKKTLNDIAADLRSGKPMNRLIQGDVGSGKTIVSILAMLMVIDAGYQCLIMAPTEILAEQHYRSITQYLNEFEIEIFLLTGSIRSKLRKEIFAKLQEGLPSIIIGTHALFQSEVEYKNLGLVVIDEQHRFGVEQRADLIELGSKSLDRKNVSPHILVLSATPIPRTLSMTVYGDLDISIIKSMPKNRKPISTKVVFDSDRDKVYQFIKKNINEGRQSFIVYPLVEKSEKLELKAATDHFDELKNDIFPEYKLGLIHGQMPWNEKDEAMQRFLNKEFDILIATTVIEVGIDIPNANIMLIEDAHRFGLSQLHQLRGRVGRSDLQSYCFLMTKEHYKFHLNKKEEDISERNAAIIRLKTMERTTDGFELAEVDLKLRGPGDIVGTKQSGLPDFTFLDLINDGELISIVKKVVEEILIEDNNLSKYDNQILKEELIFRFGKNKSFYNIA